MPSKTLFDAVEASLKNARIAISDADRFLDAIKKEGENNGRENEQQITDCEAYLKKLGVPAIVYKMATSFEELLVMISDKKAFLKRKGYSDEEDVGREQRV